LFVCVCVCVCVHAREREREREREYICVDVQYVAEPSSYVFRMRGSC